MWGWSQSKKSSAKKAINATPDNTGSSSSPTNKSSSDLSQKTQGCSNNASPECKEQIIAGFRELLGEDEANYDDQTLWRFAVARSLQLDKAKQQLLESTRWRTENAIDQIPLPVLTPGTPILCPIRGFSPLISDANVEPVDGVPDALLEISNHFGGHAWHKWDKEGKHIYIERLGHHDARRLAKHVKQDDLISWHIRCQEFSQRVIMPEMSKRAGRVIDKETVIFDCEGMGFHQLNMGAMYLYRAIADLDQKYYPERLGTLFVVNTPNMFVRIWSIAKKWLDPGMLKKVHICGKDFKKTLLEYIPEENLPSFLGGICTCSHLPGGCVPSVILKNIPPLKRSTSNLETPDTSRSPSPTPLEAGSFTKICIPKGDQRSCEVFATPDLDTEITQQQYSTPTENKNDIMKGSVQVKFRIFEGSGEGVKFGAKFKKVISIVDDEAKQEKQQDNEDIVLPPTLVSTATELQTHDFQVKDTGEFIFTWYLDQSSSAESVGIEYSVFVDGEFYGDEQSI